jgi:hypothetical protein
MLRRYFLTYSVIEASTGGSYLWNVDTALPSGDDYVLYLEQTGRGNVPDYTHQFAIVHSSGNSSQVNPLPPTTSLVLEAPNPTVRFSFSSTIATSTTRTHGAITSEETPSTPFLQPPSSGTADESDRLSNTDKIWIGLGVGLGFPLIIIPLALGFYLGRRGRVAEAKSEPPQELERSCAYLELEGAMISRLEELDGRQKQEIHAIEDQSPVELGT